MVDRYFLLHEQCNEIEANECTTKYAHTWSTLSWNLMNDDSIHTQVLIPLRFTLPLLLWKDEGWSLMI